MEQHMRRWVLEFDYWHHEARYRCTCTLLSQRYESLKRAFSGTSAPLPRFVSSQSHRVSHFTLVTYMEKLPYISYHTVL